MSETLRFPFASGVTLCVTSGWPVLLPAKMETVRSCGGNQLEPVTVTCAPGAAVVGVTETVAGGATVKVFEESVLSPRLTTQI